MKGFVYISGPITAKHGYTVEENVAAALRVYLECIRRKVAAFCPHLSAAFPTAHHAVDYELWMDYDFAVIDRCTHVLMLPRWETSGGAVREREYAEQRGIPVFTDIDALVASL